MTRWIPHRNSKLLLNSGQPVENVTEPPWLALILASKTRRMPVKITNQSEQMHDPAAELQTMDGVT